MSGSESGSSLPLAEEPAPSASAGSPSPDAGPCRSDGAVRGPCLLPTVDLHALQGHYRRFLGQEQMVQMSRDIVPVNVAVYVFPATPTRPYLTLVTTGMGAIPMGSGELSPWDRAELMMYLSHDWDFADADRGALPVAWLGRFARWIHSIGDTIGAGHTFAIEDNSPLFPGTLLSALYLRAPVREDTNFFHCWLPSGAGCHVYWTLPITQEECYLVRSGSKESVDDALDASEQWSNFDRRSLATPETRIERRARVKAEKHRARQDPDMTVMDLRCDLHGYTCASGNDGPE